MYTHLLNCLKEKYNNDVDEYLHLLDKLEEYLKNNDFNFTLQNTKEKLVKEETYSKVLERDIGKSMNYYNQFLKMSSYRLLVRKTVRTSDHFREVNN